MKRLYFRAGMSPLRPVPIADAIQEDMFGDNTGNLVYQYSIFRTVMMPDTEIDARTVTDVFKAPGGLDRFAEECDFAIIPLANAFRKSFALKPLTEMIRRLKCPCVIVGCGVQANSIEDIRRGFPFDEDVRDFVRAVLDKSAMLGLRGELTAAYLQSLGFIPERHFTVIGCPSLFLNGPVMPEPKLKPIARDTRFSINTRYIQREEMHRLIARTEAQYPDYHLVLQKHRELRTLAFGVRSKVRDDQRDPTGYYPYSVRHPDARNGRAIGFTEARTWFQYMRDIDYSFGARIHGNIAAVINGVPSLVFTSDTRTEEICRYSNIAYLPMDQVKPDADIRDLLERADLTAVCRGHRERFAHYIDFLNQNGVDHIYRETWQPETVPFDEAMKSVPVGGTVRQGCVPAPVALMRYLQYYIGRVPQKLGLRK